MIKDRRLLKGEDGFSLIELVIAVSILLVLTTGGLLAYNGVIKDNRRAAMEIAASVVVNEALENVMDFDDNSTIDSAIEKWNNEDNNDFKASYNVVDDCVNVILTDEKGKVDPVVRSNDKLCNIEI